MTDVATGPGWELRLGDYREVLADVTCDALITDPPYSARTHEGQRSGERPRGGGGRKTKIEYESLAGSDPDSLATTWSPRVRWWTLVFSDHAGAYEHEACWEAAGWYVFAPVGYVRTLPTPRLSGDGPTSALEYLVVSRPKHRLPPERVGSRPGFYLVPDSQHGSPHPGGKHLEVMRAIIRDYTLPGDVVVDTCAGGATTLLAAVIEGRTAIGAERDPETWEKAVRRLRRGYTAVFDFGGAR